MAVSAEQQELLRGFLEEAGELIEGVDHDLIALEKSPRDSDLLNRVFRGFHTVKGGAGFLELGALVELCHRAEGLLDRLRRGELDLGVELMDLILAATAEVQRMFGEIARSGRAQEASAALLAALDRAAAGLSARADLPPRGRADPLPGAPAYEPDWQALLDGLLGKEAARTLKPAAPAAPPARNGGAQKETTLRVDTARFDQILNLSGEIGLARNRLACLAGRRGAAQDDDGAALEKAVAQLDTLVADLQGAVMKARMQPVGRVFQKYVRLARDLGRQLGKEVDLALEGEDTEVDKNVLEELNDPLVHLVRNAIDHGVEPPAERAAAGKPGRATVRLAARQAGDHIVIEVADDGRGMRPEAIRAKAVEKGVLGAAEAAQLDDRASLELIFLPGFSTCSQASEISGRGVGMDVVRTNVQKLKGRVELESVPGRGTRARIELPLTLAILPVLMLAQGGQSYAIPLSAVREVVALGEAGVQAVGGKSATVLRGEVLPVVALDAILGAPAAAPGETGVVMQVRGRTLVLRTDAVLGQDEVMIKPLEGVKPHGVAGATQSGDGELVLVLELQELLG